jgi:AAA domain
MISINHLAVLIEYAARNRCKVILAGDQEQLAAVEGGGAMMLLADRLGYVQLAEPVRFTAAWERAASLRLRRGDATALDEYDQHGRIRGAPPDHAVDQAARAYCCPAFKMPMKVAFGVPMWGCGKAPQPGWLRGFGGGGAGGCG